MNEFILFLHFVGLMIGSAGGIGSGIIMRRALTMPPEQAQTLRGLGPFLANVAGVGVGLLWITGLIMVWAEWDGLGSLPGLFWVKFFFVIVATGLLAAVHMTYAQIRRTGNPALGARLAILGPANGLSFVLIVLFAAYAFS